MRKLLFDLFHILRNLSQVDNLDQSVFLVTESKTI